MSAAASAATRRNPTAATARRRPNSNDQERSTMTATTRVQLALNVEDIDAATAFYTRLFGVAPHKQRPGYANFAVEDPPLKLVLFENPSASERLNHLGIETMMPEDVPEA